MSNWLVWVWVWLWYGSGWALPSCLRNLTATRHPDTLPWWEPGESLLHQFKTPTTHPPT